MIQIEEISIKEFRGVRDITLNPNRKNFAICGPNGTGKSGIVDALEFALTGKISRLEGEGMGKVSVIKHGPHVDCKDNPEKASVTLKVFIPSLNKTATIHRTVKNSSVLEITPNTPEIKAILMEAAMHPEFALSRRQIIKYVVAEPGKRDKDVQALLRLDSIGVVRARLQKIANSIEKTQDFTKDSAERCGEELATAMELKKLSSEAILEAANSKRNVLSLSPILALDNKTVLTEGLTVLDEQATAEKIQKSVASADMKALEAQIKLINTVAFQNSCLGAIASLDSLQGEDLGKDGATKDDLLEDALRLYDEKTCPVCDVEWKPEDFRTHIRSKLKKMEAVTKKKAATIQRLESLSIEFDKLLSLLRPAYKYAGLISPAIKPEHIGAYGKSVTVLVAQLRKFSPLTETIKTINVLQIFPQYLLDEIKSIQDGIEKLPEASSEDAARDYLTIAQERLEKWKEALGRHKKSQHQFQTATAVLNVYNSVATKALEKIYKDVEVLFKELYQSINDDEDKFSAELIPSAGKLGFDVDFYGRGFFPPGAYHSEGHQDAMGLCLYLALMKHLMGTNFTFAVLDDVLMSVDTGHRREVSKMLKEKFPNTQFVLTTHDEVWLRAMKSSGLVQDRGMIRFRDWNVDQGPTKWDNRNVWQEIGDYLNSNDVRAAASLLRHYLEYITADVCDNFRASVEFHGDGSYMLGDLMPSAIGAFNARLKTAIAAAESWGDQEGEDFLVAMHDGFIKIATASNVEQWQLNAAVHYNEWVNLDKKDFKPVADVFKTLISHFSCPSCDGILYVLMDGKRPSTLKCGCPKMNINLSKKPKEFKAETG